MKCESIISWLGTLEGCDRPTDTRTERLLRPDTVLRASRLLGKKEFRLMTLHDIEGHSLDLLQTTTGLSQEAIKASVIEARVKLAQLLHRKSTKRPPIKSEGNES